MPNFVVLGCLEVGEKFSGGGVGEIINPFFCFVFLRY